MRKIFPLLIIFLMLFASCEIAYTAEDKAFKTQLKEWKESFKSAEVTNDIENKMFVFERNNSPVWKEKEDVSHSNQVKIYDFTTTPILVVKNGMKRVLSVPVLTKSEQDFNSEDEFEDYNYSSSKFDYKYADGFRYGYYVADGLEPNGRYYSDNGDLTLTLWYSDKKDLDIMHSIILRAQEDSNIHRSEIMAVDMNGVNCSYIVYRIEDDYSDDVLEGIDILISLGQGEMEIRLLSEDFPISDFFPLLKSVVNRVIEEYGQEEN